MSDNVETVRAEVAAMASTWTMIADVVAGEQALKARDLDVPGTYIPVPNPDEYGDPKSAKDSARYQQYVKRASFYPATGRTLEGLVGMGFGSPVVELPDLLKPMEEDVDGAGISLVQQMADAGRACLRDGGCGLLVDYPRMEGPATREQIATGKVKPRIVKYDRSNIINWRTSMSGANEVATLIVLKESVEEVDEENVFATETSDRYRVLRLVDGVYQVDLYTGTEGGGYTVESWTPKDFRGQPWTEIPFVPVGALNNDWKLDKPPILDLALKNLGHWRNSADHEWSVFIHGQPTLVLSGVNEDWAGKFMGKAKVGASGGIMLPVNASALLLQVNPNSMTKQAMDDKRAEMISIGAKLIESKPASRTATEARIEFATEIATLGSVCANVQNAYLHLLPWAGMMVGAQDGAVVEISPDFALNRLTAQEIQQLVAAWQGGLISLTEARSMMRATGWATQDDEEAKDEIDANRPEPSLPALPVQDDNNTGG